MYKTVVNKVNFFCLQDATLAPVNFSPDPPLFLTFYIDISLYIYIFFFRYQIDCIKICRVYVFFNGIMFFINELLLKNNKENIE